VEAITMGKVYSDTPQHLWRQSADNEFENPREVVRSLQPEQPVYLFDRDHLAQRARRFQTEFPGTVAYAVKANTRRRVLSTLIESGIRDFDVASIFEIRSLTAISSNLVLHFNNPVKSAAAIRSAYHDYGVRSFALDDAVELEKILHACGQAAELMLSVRFKLDRHQAAYDFGSKFGATPEPAIALLRSIQKSGARAALTFHPGSQCTDPGEYVRYIHAASEIVRSAGVALRQLNVGGGFPEHYSNVNVLPRHDYIDTISRAMAHAFKDAPPALMCEPGRAMVASSISLLCRVIHVRNSERTVFINDGVYGGMQEQCLADFRLPLRVWRDASRVQGTSLPFTVFGPTCDPSDCLPRSLDLPADICAGDYLEFGLAGAYGSATATRFNGFDSQCYVNVRNSR